MNAPYEPTATGQYAIKLGKQHGAEEAHRVKHLVKPMNQEERVLYFSAWWSVVVGHMKAAIGPEAARAVIDTVKLIADRGMPTCATCKGDPAVCAAVPGLRHCEAAQRGDGSAAQPLRPHVCLLVRPLLVQGQLALDKRGFVILIDSEQDSKEQVISLWHETLHLLGLADEILVEEYAVRLADACPDILRKLCDRINVPDSPDGQ